MTELNDHDLLAQYARTRSEAAFAALVARHVNLVYSSALRFTGNPHYAEEITQAVFVILARKAGGLRGTLLAGWLYQTVRLTAANFVKTEARRQRREQEAYMQSTLTESDPAAWEQIAPLLDEAMGRLGETDRNAIILRFFENKTAQEVALALNLKEGAAHMRVTRAVEKLRKYFISRGVTLSAAIIAGAVATNSVQAAPAGLAATVTATAAQGAAVGTSTLTLIKGALKIMAWTKAKTAIVAGVSVLLAAGTTTLVVEKIAQPKLSSTDLSWADDPKYWALNSRVLEKNPPVIILRKTRFPKDGGNVQVGDRILYKRTSLQGLMAKAYETSEFRAIFSDVMPQDNFDLMLTLPRNSLEALREEIKKQFGLVAHNEKRETDVIYLKFHHANAPGLVPSKGGNQYWSSASSPMFSKTKTINIPFRNMRAFFEYQLKKPILDHTGLNGNYDTHFSWRWSNNLTETEAFKQAVLDQLGIELVPARESIEMLIVEKIK